MKSYRVYIDSEFSKDRIPYIEKPKSPLRDPVQVAIAYNERCIPKLSELLIYNKLPKEKRALALFTLNELVSNQEYKVEMIDNNIVSYSACLMVDEYSETRKEACYLLGSLMFLEKGRREFNNKQENFTFLNTILFDTISQVRTSAGWMVYRLSIHRDGVEMINMNQTVFKLIDAFIKYSQIEYFEQNQDYLLYILGSFVNISMYDKGINNSLDKGLLKIFNKILKNSNNEYSNILSIGKYSQMKEILLNIVKNITLLKQGKNETISEDMISTISKFLSSEKDNERLFSSSFMMCVSNNITAKKMISSYSNSITGRYEILENLCELLKINKFLNHSNGFNSNLDLLQDTKNNSISALKAISELPEAFIKIVDILHDELVLLNEVFGIKALKGLAELLPKLSKYKNPPVVEKEKVALYSKYIKGIIYYIKHYDEEAIGLLINETVNFNQKLGPFLIMNDNKIYKQARNIINKICCKDNHNKQIIHKFIEKYGGEIKDKTFTKDNSESLHLSEIN